MGEERVECMSYYKEDRLDEVMNECMRRKRKGQKKKPANSSQRCPIHPRTQW